MGRYRLNTAKWKYDKDWVYSATYDEALIELHRFVVPCHEELGIPGHLEAVSGHLGVIRNIGASSYNGMRHMSGAELRDMMKRGWGVGCHSYSHGMVMDDPEKELLTAKKVLEDAIGRQVTIYTAPGSNANLTPEIAALARAYGFIGGMSITDDLNYPDAPDLFYINRPPLHEKFSDLYDSAFDAYKRISQAKKKNGWLADYLHCPLEKAVHDYKDVSEAHHRERLETVCSEGRHDCWFANPDDVVDYRYMRRHCRISETAEGCFTVSSHELPGEVMNRELTFLLSGCASPEAAKITGNGRELTAWPVGPGRLAFNAVIKDNCEINIGEVMK